MDGKNDIGKEAPRRPEADRQPPREIPAARREPEDGAATGPTRYRDWASI